MTNPLRRNTKLWEFLEQSGVLESQDESQIQAAKKEYKRLYQKQYRQERKKVIKEVHLTLQNHEWLALKKAADTHRYTLTAFIRHAALAYLNQEFLVPDREPITRLEQRLRLCQTDLRVIAKHASKLSQPELESSYTQLADRLQRLETAMVKAITNPPAAPKAAATATEV